LIGGSFDLAVAIAKRIAPDVLDTLPKFWPPQDFRVS